MAEQPFTPLNTPRASSVDSTGYEASVSANESVGRLDRFEVKKPDGPKCFAWLNRVRNYVEQFREFGENYGEREWGPVNQHYGLLRTYGDSGYGWRKNEESKINWSELRGDLRAKFAEKCSRISLRSLGEEVMETATRVGHSLGACIASARARLGGKRYFEMPRETAMLRLSTEHARTDAIRDEANYKPFGDDEDPVPYPPMPVQINYESLAQVSTITEEDAEDLLDVSLQPTQQREVTHEPELNPSSAPTTPNAEHKQQ